MQFSSLVNNDVKVWALGVIVEPACLLVDWLFIQPSVYPRVLGTTVKLYQAQQIEAESFSVIIPTDIEFSHTQVTLWRHPSPGS